MGQGPDVRGVYRDKDGLWFAGNLATGARCSLSLSAEQMMALNAAAGGEWDEELDALARAYTLAWRRKEAEQLGIR